MLSMWGKPLKLLLFISMNICCINATKVSGTFQILTPTGVGIENMVIVKMEQLNGGINNANGRSSEYHTDSSGSVIIPLNSRSTFELKGTKDGYQDMYIVGTTGDTDFRYPTYMGTRAEAHAVAALMDFEYDPGKGWIIVGMDTEELDGSLSPAVGASAELLGISSDVDPFVFDILLPQYGNTITNTSSSFVTWANVEVDIAGDVVVKAPTREECIVSPKGSNSEHSGEFTINSTFNKVIARADAVTIICYLCS